MWSKQHTNHTLSLIVKILNTWIVFFIPPSPHSWSLNVKTSHMPLFRNTPLSPHFWSLCGEIFKLSTSTSPPLQQHCQFWVYYNPFQVDQINRSLFMINAKKKKIIICCLTMLYLTLSILMPSFINIQLFKFSNTLKSSFAVCSHNMIYKSIIPISIVEVWYIIIGIIFMLLIIITGRLATYSLPDLTCSIYTLQH